MASGIITLTRTGSGYLNGQILWESVSNGTVENTSSVTATLQLQRGAQNTTTGTFKGVFTVGSTNVSISEFLALPSNTWVTVKTITVTVSHNANGVGSCYMYAKIDGPSGTTMAGTSVSGSETVDLDEIARVARILSATDFTDEENPTITYSNPAGSATTKLQACISVTGEDDDIAFRDIPISGKSYTFSLTTAERDVLRSAAANSNTLSLKFVVRSTVSGVEGKTNTKATMTVVNASPTATFSVVDTNSATTALTGNSNNFIALHSTPKVTLNVTTKKSATIPSKGVEISDGITVWKKNGSFEGEISPLSSGDINYKVTDSRGNMVGGGVKRTFIAYFNPTIQIDNITRDGSGNLTVVASGEAFVGSFGSKSNARTLYYRYKKSTDKNYTSWMQLSSSEVVWDGNKFTATKKISGLDYTKSYNVHVSITDSLHTGDDRVIARKTGLSAFPVFEWGADDFKFNVPVVMSGNPITGLPSPTTDDEPVTVSYMQSYIMGFGIGATSGAPSVSDLNNATECGWYSFSDGCENTPFSYGAVFVAKRYSEDAVQIAVNTRQTGSIGERLICVRSRNNTTWSAWEYINPPYKPGVEYPTVERHDGKVVYAKLVDLGDLPDSSNMNITYTTTAAAFVVSFEVFATRKTDNMKQSFPIISDGGSVHAKARASTNKIYVYTLTDLSTYTGQAKIKYTKN